MKKITRVKICGITNYDDAKNAADLGADYLGFNFYKKSQRYIAALKAKKIIENLSQKPQHCLNVAVFVNEPIDKIRDIIDFCRIDIIQLSGDEDADFMLKLKKSTNKKIIKTFRIRNTKKTFPDFDFRKSFFDYIMMDSFKKGFYGGTGAKFDWSIAKHVDKKRLFLSGGLNADNVGEAIKRIKPYAVDVCSGVEKSLGRKDFEKMKEFIYQVKLQKSERVV